MDAQWNLHGEIGTPPQPHAQAPRARANPAVPSSSRTHCPRYPVSLDWRCRMQPEAPAALARTGLVVVACWVLNAPVLLAIRVLWARVGLAVVPPAPLVTAALLSAARASDCRMPPARRRRRQPSRERSISPPPARPLRVRSRSVASGPCPLGCTRHVPCGPCRSPACVWSSCLALRPPCGICRVRVHVLADAAGPRPVRTLIELGRGGLV